MDVVAKVERSSNVTTPTAAPAISIVCSAMDSSPLPHCSSTADKRCPSSTNLDGSTDSEGHLIDLLGIFPQAPVASFLLPPPPPSSPIGDEASAQAIEQSTTATTRAGSLASFFRSPRSAHVASSSMRRVEEDAARPAGCPPRSISAATSEEECVTVQSKTNVPVVLHVAAATATGGAAARAAVDAPLA